MNTKEAIDIRKWIEFFKSQRDDHFVYESLTKDYNKVILLLKRLDKKSKRGKKFEAIVKEIGYNLDWHKPECPFSTPDGELIDEILEMIDNIKQKYFPKGNIEDVVKGITEQIKESAEIAKKEMKTNETKMV